MLILLLAAAQAAPLPWTSLPLRPAAPESPALGPDWFVVGPDGPVVFDAADRRLYALDLAARAARPLPLPAADDALRLDQAGAGALLLRDDRTVWVIPAGPQGWIEPRQSLALPDVVPPGPLAQSGDRVYAVDVFGNLHPAFDLATDRNGPALSAAADPALVGNPRPVRRAGTPAALTVDGAVRATCADPCGGYLLGDWLIVEERAGSQDGTGPLTVRRSAVHLKTGRRADLSPGPRLYAPTRDLAVDAEGDLWWMIPGEAGLSFVEVRP